LKGVALQALLERKRGIAAGLAVAFCFWLTSCGPTGQSTGSKKELVVAAAANLTGVFEEIGRAFTFETGIRVIYSFGSTTQLAQQIEGGAPFDVFAAADAEHVDQLVTRGKIVPGSQAVYARGRLALWVPDSQLFIHSLRDLLQPVVRYVAVANPDFAPYGRATVEALQKEGLWGSLESKIIRTENVNAAKQLAATGNAETAFTAYSSSSDLGTSNRRAEKGDLGMPLPPGYSCCKASVKFK
jgi:molybdate transport system substrate-binding protein